jgi:RluA family pseudouridine synthase
MGADNTIKLSSPETGGFWEIPILFEDESLIALDKPSGLLTSPDRLAPDRPSLMTLLRRGIKKGAPWVQKKNITYLENAHRLDADVSGAIILAKNKPVLIDLATQFGSEKPNRTIAALVRGVAAPEQNEFKTDAKLAPDPLREGLTRVDPKLGKRARTEFSVRERFEGYMLMECRPLTARPHQLQVHLKHVGFKLVGDEYYGGPPLLLSSLKDNYRLKRGREERPLMARPALHLEKIVLTHPITKEPLTIESPWAKDFAVSVKYLRRWVASSNNQTEPLLEEQGGA